MYLCFFTSGRTQYFLKRLIDIIQVELKKNALFDAFNEKHLQTLPTKLPIICFWSSCFPLKVQEEAMHTYQWSPCLNNDKLSIFHANIPRKPCIKNTSKNPKCAMLCTSDRVGSCAYVLWISTPCKFLSAAFSTTIYSCWGIRFRLFVFLPKDLLFLCIFSSNLKPAVQHFFPRS